MGPISYSFGDTRRFQSKIATISHRVYLVPPLSGFFLEMGNTGWAQETSMMWLPGGERSLAISLAVWIHQIKSNHISILLNSGSHESGLVTRKVHSHTITNYKT